MGARAIISRPVGLAIIGALVCARSAAILLWSDVYFDADQAVMGLMAKHIAEGRAFPVMQYGQQYVLVIEAWLAAPLMLVSDHSPALLRVVPVAFNVVTAVLLYGMLSLRTGLLGPFLALVATLPVAMPSLNASDELSAALGMNIEPLFFSLLLWLLRERPVALGVVAAIGIKNREFVLYAVAALLFIDFLRDRTAAFWRPRLAALVAFGLTWSLIGWGQQLGSPLGPGTGGMHDAAGGNLSVATGALCIVPAEMPGDIRTVATELLPLQFGVRSVRWAQSGNPGVSPPDASWLWLPLVAMFAFGVFRGLWRAWRHGPSALTWLGLYLVMIGLQAVVVYALTRCGHASFFTMRYTLLSLFIPAGALVLAFEREGSVSVRAFVGSVAAVWFGVCALGHVAILRGFVASPPVGSYRVLAEYLDQHDIRFIRSDYWTGYHVAFLTSERVRALTGFDRVQEHVLAVKANMDDSVEIRRLTDAPCEGAIVAKAFYVCDRPRRGGGE